MQTPQNDSIFLWRSCLQIMASMQNSCNGTLLRQGTNMYSQNKRTLRGCVDFASPNIRRTFSATEISRALPFQTSANPPPAKGLSPSRFTSETNRYFGRRPLILTTFCRNLSAVLQELACLSICYGQGCQLLRALSIRMLTCCIILVNA